MTGSVRLEFRLRPDSKSAIERAAEEKAERILREHEATTTVPAEFFDELLDALDAPADPSTRLRQAAQRARERVKNHPVFGSV